MTPANASHLPRPSRGGAAAVGVLTAALLVLTVLTWAPPSQAQGHAKAQEQGVRWRELKPAQQVALKPLEHEWPAIGSAQKQKWIELSRTFGKRPPAEQDRIRERMGAWAQLSAQQRGEARLHYQEATQLAPQDRQARWAAYQALSPDQKKQLAARAAPVAGPPVARAAVRPRSDSPQAKSNIVPNPAYFAEPKVIAPTVLQARPGATTTLINRRPTPPSHEQTGLPKIAATPEFVNRATLLPRRGPQGAATRSAGVPASAPRAAQ